VSITGMDDLARNLDRLQEMQRKAVERSCGQIAALLEEAASANMPAGAKGSAGMTPPEIKANIETAAQFMTIVLTVGMDQTALVQLAQQGNWGWLLPVLEANKDRFMEILAGNMQL
jgi:hypothetical protein